MYMMVVLKNNSYYKKTLINSYQSFFIKFNYIMGRCKAKTTKNKPCKLSTSNSDKFCHIHKKKIQQGG
jgi:hypothetical protein